MGPHGFLLSSRFIDGGVTGVSMLLAKVLGLPLPALILVINHPFIALGYAQVPGRAFAARSAAAIVGLSACLATVHFPDVTPDKLLTAVFGGVLHQPRRHGTGHQRAATRGPRRHRRRGSC